MSESLFTKADSRDIEPLLFQYSHDPSTLRQTVEVINDPLPEWSAMTWGLWQALCGENSPWAQVTTADVWEDAWGPLDATLAAADCEDYWVHFHVEGLEASYRVVEADEQTTMFLLHLERFGAV